VALMANSGQTGVLRILDCSRGLSDWYPPRLDDNQLAEAWDVEFWDGSVCGRRNGCIIQIGAPANTTGYSLFVHTPTTRRVDDRLALAVRGADLTNYVILYEPSWANVGIVSVPDTLDFSQGVDWASLHGKLFIATKSNTNRLHVYNPSYQYIRPTGTVPIPSAQVVAANIAGAQTYFDNRQFRVRYTRQVSGVTVLRSEPSFPVTPFTPPAGNCTGVQIQIDGTGRDAWVTHWETEELSGGFWYRIGTTSITLNTFNTNYALTQVPINGVLSEDVGDYTTQYSARYLTVDEDRLILGGSFDEEAKSARVSWTPIGIGSGNGSVGVGNDERLPTDVNGYLDFDMLDGGGLTGIKAWEGKVIAFKRGQVHQMVRSNSRLRAYLPDTLSRRRRLELFVFSRS
jgi:hypothetical protein